MGVGPGIAPEASLVRASRSTAAAAVDQLHHNAAFDWALDPNGDGDFADHLDIVDLSLGVDFDATDDPDNLVVEHGQHGTASSWFHPTGTTVT